MHILVKTIPLLALFSFLLMLTGCSPEVGSEAWCTAMNEKDKADWTANEAADYTKHCIFK